MMSDLVFCIGMNACELQAVEQQCMFRRSGRLAPDTGGPPRSPLLRGLAPSPLCVARLLFDHAKVIRSPDKCPDGFAARITSPAEARSRRGMGSCPLLRIPLREQRKAVGLCIVCKRIIRRVTENDREFSEGKQRHDPLPAAVPLMEFRSIAAVASS